jgi:hypothetical protein
MLGRAVKYKKQINDFTATNIELRPLELTVGDWEAIELVMEWLYAFREATEQMSATKSVTLSACHAVLHNLQNHLRTALSKLPDSAPPQLRQGLVKAHQKLSDYHTHFDESPYYLWACRTWQHFLCYHASIMLPT